MSNETSMTCSLICSSNKSPFNSFLFDIIVLPFSTDDLLTATFVIFHHVWLVLNFYVYENIS